MKRLIGIGDNVADKFVDRKVMYPGGNAYNVSVYSAMCGVSTAYLGVFGTDMVARHNQEVLKQFKVDMSRSRICTGENGCAEVYTKKGERIFLGSNKGGCFRNYHWQFSLDDLKYIEQFYVIHTSLNSYIEEALPDLKKAENILSFDFSNRWTEEYLDRVCPWCDVACLSGSGLQEEEILETMRQVQHRGVPLVIITKGEDGSYLYYKGKSLFQPSIPVEVIDTMGAGDAYIAAFLTEVFCKGGGKLNNIPCETLQHAMEAGARFAAEICKSEGAFGYGIEFGKEEIV